MLNLNSGVLHSKTFFASGRNLPVRVAGGQADPRFYDGGTSQRWVAEDAVGSFSGPAFATIDMRIKYTHQLPVGRGEFFLDIFNVLDEKAWTQVFGGPLPVTVGYCLRETIERDPDAVQGYVSACYRAQRWIQRAADAEILDLLHKPYMDTFSRDDVLKSIRYYRGILDWDFLVDERAYQDVLKIFLATRTLEGPIPFARAVDPSFVRKAAQKS